MQKTLLVILLFAILIVIFALQNSAEVVINLWFWSINISLALIVILAFALGALVGILFSIPQRRRKKSLSPVRDSNEATGEENMSAGEADDGDPEFEDLTEP